MDNSNIINHEALVLRIRFLRAEKSRQESEMKEKFHDLIYLLDPVSIVKGSLHELAENKQVQFDVAKVALNMGTNLVIDQVFGKYRSIKGFLSSVLLEKMSDRFINTNTLKIFSLFSKKKKHSSEKESIH